MSDAPPFGRRRRQAPRRRAAKAEPRLPTLKDLGFDPDAESTELTEFRAARHRQRFGGVGGWTTALPIIVLSAISIALNLAGSKLYLLSMIAMIAFVLYRAYRFRRALDEEKVP